MGRPWARSDPGCAEQCAHESSTAESIREVYGIERPARATLEERHPWKSRAAHELHASGEAGAARRRTCVSCEVEDGWETLSSQRTSLAWLAGNQLHMGSLRIRGAEESMGD